MLVKLQLCALLILVFTSPVAHADFFYDPFSYQAGTQLVQQAGGVGFQTGWFAGGFNISRTNFAVDATGLSYNNLLATGGAVSTPSGATINGIARTPVRGGFPSGTSYLSFLLRRNSIDGAFGGFGGLYLDGSLTDVFIGKPGSNDFWSIEERGGANLQSSNITANVNQTSLLVLKMETAGAVDTFSLFINPVVGAPEPTPNLVKTNINIGVWDALVFYNSGAYTYDELRIGDTFADVTPSIVAVPEPALLGAAGLGMVILCRYRAKRKQSCAN